MGQITCLQKPFLIMNCLEQNLYSKTLVKKIIKGNICSIITYYLPLEIGVTFIIYNIPWRWVRPFI